MSKFIQLHILTSYPPSNVNRDDMGRPKTAMMGGTERLRISSQSLKRSWRTSDTFQQALGGHIGSRTKLVGNKAFDKFIAAGIKEKDALAWAVAIGGVFGKNKQEKKKDIPEIEQLAHISAHEQSLVDALINKLITENRAPEDSELELLINQNQAVDIALFGRMLAKKPVYNVEAACQVAHSLSVHSILVEDDFFTAVDDLNDRTEDAGSSHLGEVGFAAALFYTYVCIDKELLVENLNGDEEFAHKAIKALTESAVTVTPSGKQNTFASRAYASYVLAEKGDKQPRSLSVAYLQSVDAKAIDEAAVEALESQRDNFDKVYGKCAELSNSFNVSKGEGSLTELLDFVGS